MRVYACIHARRVRVYACIHVRVYACIHACIHVCVCMPASMQDVTHATPRVLVSPTLELLTTSDFMLTYRHQVTYLECMNSVTTPLWPVLCGAGRALSNALYVKCAPSVLWDRCSSHLWRVSCHVSPWQVVPNRFSLLKPTLPCCTGTQPTEPGMLYNVPSQPNHLSPQTRLHAPKSCREHASSNPTGGD